MNEAEFKEYILDLWNTPPKTFDYVMHIETEETEAGFPDTIVKLKDSDSYMFFEFKVSDKFGKFKFTNNQPRFYRAHKRMKIYVIAWDNRIGARTFYMRDALSVVKNISTNLKVDIDEVFDSEHREFPKR